MSIDFEEVWSQIKPIDADEPSRHQERLNETIFNTRRVEVIAILFRNIVMALINY